MTKLEQVQQALKDSAEYCRPRLPVVGILAFSMCSVSAVHNLFATSATNAIEAFWFAALLVELVTAWLVMQVVGMARKTTLSNISKQDKRFYGGLLIAFVVLAFPSLALSVQANRVEFGGNWGLGLVFPGLSVACAIGAAIPGALTRHTRDKAKAKQASDKAQAKRDKESAEESKEQAELAQRAANERQSQAELAQVLDELTQVQRRVLAELTQDGRKTQASIAQTLDMKRQAVGYHIKRLQALGLIRRNGKGIEVLVEVER